jgi:Origin of replication binding protein
MNRVISLPTGCKPGFSTKDLLVKGVVGKTGVLKGTERVFAFPSIKKSVNEQAKEYIWLPNYGAVQGFLNQAQYLDSRNGGKNTPHWYEVIIDKKTTPVWLGMDVEKTLYRKNDEEIMGTSEAFNAHAEMMITTLLTYLERYMEEEMGVKYKLEIGKTCQVGESHRQPKSGEATSKISFHVKVTIKMPSHKYTGMMMRSFTRWVESQWDKVSEEEEGERLKALQYTKREEKGSKYGESVVDCGIYTDFRLMRCLYSSKNHGDTRFLEPYKGSSKQREDHLMMYHEEQGEKDKGHMLDWSINPPKTERELVEDLSMPTSTTKVTRGSSKVSKIGVTKLRERTNTRDTTPRGDYYGMPKADIESVRGFIETDAKIREYLGGSDVRVRNIVESQTRNKLIINIEKRESCKCPIANRVHTSNNGYYVYDIEERIGVYQCHNVTCRGQQCKRYWFTMDKLGSDKEHKEKLESEEERYKLVTEVVSLNAMRKAIKDLSFVDTMYQYNSPEMRYLEVSEGITVIEAGCGLGKSEAICRYINTLDKSVKIMVISATRSVCRKMYSDLEEEGFELYQDDKKGGYLDKDRVVVCLNSLTRLRSEEAKGRYDILIIDEALSVSQAYMQPGHMMDHTTVGGIFECLLTWTPRVVMMDANMSHLAMVLMLNRVKEMREKKGSASKLTWVRNTHVRSTNREARMIYVGQKEEEKNEAKETLCEEVLECLGKGERVCIAVSSPEVAEYIGASVNQKYPDKKIGMYTSMTDEETKIKDFANVNESFARYELLMYSPTITAGVSFTKQHYDRLFAWFINSPGTPPADVCLQMLFRVRALTTGKMTIYISVEGRRVPLTPSSLLYPT